MVKYKEVNELEELNDDSEENKGRISIDQYNKEIEEAEAEMDRGIYHTHDDLKKQMKKWW